MEITVNRQEIQNNELEFKKIVNENIHRYGIDGLMSWLDSTDFFTAPASTKYHGAEPGGLCAHSLSVYKCLKAKQDSESDESIAITALFHDLCKVNFFKLSTRNIKDDNGKWVTVPCFTINEDEELPVGHGEKSVIILMKYMNLTDEEICSVRWHMGFSVVEQMFEKPSMSKALSKYKLVLKLQVADQESSFWNNI